MLDFPPVSPELQLPPRGSLSPNNDVDPLRYYYTPFVGRIFTARINLGLALLGERRFPRLLEIGFGSGLLLPTLTGIADVVDGIDLASDPDEVRGHVARLGATVGELVRGDACALPFPDGRFDAAVAFSIFEHLRAPQLAAALREARRVLVDDGLLLVGCPAVHAGMTAAMAAIGFFGIDDHHVSSIHDVLTVADPWFTVERRDTLPRGVPLGWAPYGAVLLRKRRTDGATRS